MCWFVTIAVAQKHRGAFESSLEPHRVLQFTRLSSSSPTANAFTGDASCIEVTHGGCSCDLYSPPPAPGQAERDLKRERQRLIGKGWSSSKIERALKAKAESGSRPHRNHEVTAALGSLIAELVGKLGAVDLFAHFYTGNQHEEAVGSPEHSSVSLSQFSEAGFPPDTIVTVRDAAG